MKYTKLFFGNQYVTKFHVSGKKHTLFQKIGNWIKHKVLLSAKICVVAWMVVGGVKVGQNYTPSHVVYADHEVIKEVESDSPVMTRIAQCESSGNHMGKKGQITIKVNTNGTYDIGKYQINSIWNAQATKLGYDLTKEEDNKAFAMYLYKNQGTGPWSSSSKCWSR